MKSFKLALLFLILLPWFSVDAQTVFPNRGGTGTTVIPTVGQVLVGQANGTYAPMPTSTLGISGGGSNGFGTSSIDTEAKLEAILTDVTNLLTNNDSTSDLTEGSNLYYTPGRVQSALVAGYNAIFGNSTTTNATSTNLAVTGSFNFLGTVITNVSSWFSGLFNTNFAAKDTDDLTEGDNQYFTPLRARQSISETVTGIDYNNTTGVFSLTTGYDIPLTASTSNWNNFYNTPSNRIAVSGNLAWSGNTLGIAAGYVIPLSASTTQWAATRNIVAASSTAWDTAYGWGNHASVGYLSNITGLLSAGSNISITGSGTSGSPYQISAASAGSGGIASTSPFNNGELVVVANAGTVKSVATGTLSENIAGVEFDGNPITIAPSRTLSLTTGYGIPLTASTTQWAAAYASSTALTPAYIRGLWSENVTGLDYTPSTGVLSTTNGYGIPLTASTTEWSAAFASTTALTPSYIRNVFSNTATGLTYNSSTGATTLTANYIISLSASTTEWTNFYNTPSTRISDGNALTWSGNILNFDGGNTPGGILGGTWASPTIDANSVSSTTLTGLNYAPGYLLQASSSALGGMSWVATSSLGISSAASSATTTEWRSTVQGWTFPDGSNVNTDIQANRFHTIKPIWYEVTSGGGLFQRIASSTQPFGYNATNTIIIKDNSTEQFVTVSGNDPEIHTLTASTTLTNSAITTLVGFATSTGFTGIELDWEGFGSWTAGETTDYVNFVRQLSNEAHKYGLKTMIYLPPIWNSCSNCEAGSGDEWDSANSSNYYELAYEDFENVPVDYLLIAVYDYQFDYSSGRPNSPLKWQDDIISFAKRKISDHDRIIIGIPGAGYGGATSGYIFAPLTYQAASAITGFGGATRDSESGELTWTNGGNSYFISDNETINIKRQRAERQGINRVSIWHIGDNKYGNRHVEPTLQDSPKIFSNLSAHGISGGSILRLFTNTGTKILDALNTGVTTLLGTWDFSGATVKQHTYKSFTWPGTATTTSATTTVPLGTAYTAEVWNGADCWVTASTGAFNFSDGSNLMNGATAATTVARTTLSTNNTFTAGERRYVNIGPLTAAQISCTVDVTVNN